MRQRVLRAGRERSGAMLAAFLGREALRWAHPHTVSPLPPTLPRPPHLHIQRQGPDAHCRLQRGGNSF